MPQPREIIIRSADEKGPLNVDERQDADPGDTIIWTLRPDTLAESLHRIEIKHDSYNIFERGHPICDGNTCTGRIRSDAGGKECNYTIVWLDYERAEKRHDPIISVRPSVIKHEKTKSAPIPKLFLGMALGLAAVFTFQWFRKKR